MEGSVEVHESPDRSNVSSYWQSAFSPNGICPYSLMRLCRRMDLTTFVDHMWASSVTDEVCSRGIASGTSSWGH